MSAPNECPECEQPPDEGECLIEIPERFQQRSGITMTALWIEFPAICRDCLWDIASRRGIVQPGHRLGWSTEGDRQSLDGKDIHCGSAIELYMGAGRWMRVRYETTRRDAPKGKLFRPLLYLNRTKDAEHVRERNELLALVDNDFSTTCPLGVLYPDQEARFRWPPKSEPQRDRW